jgi:DNA-directed RNA polymerase specialized sigma24 family protein
MATPSIDFLLQEIRRFSGSHSEQKSDRQLLERFRASRDEAAFTALVRRHGSMVFGVCRRVLHQEQDAEDAFQATFLVLSRKAVSLCPTRSAGGWLHEVAYHLALRVRENAARRRRNEMEVRPITLSEDPTLEVCPA